MAEALPTPSFPVTQLDLVEEEVRRLRASSMPHGHVAKAVLHNRDLRVVLMALRAGTEIPRHHAKGSLAIEVLEGRVIVGLLESSFDLGPGRMLAIELAIDHSVVAIEDSALMLMVTCAGSA